MKFNVSIALLATAGSAAATFKLKTVSANSEINGKTLNAAQSKIFTNLQNQNARCQFGTQDDATFQLRDGKLTLYATKSAPQQVYAQTITAEQGKMGYIRPGQDLPPGGQLTGWAVDGSGHLQISGVGFVACPGAGQGAWTIYADVGHHDDCLKIEVEAVDEPKPLSCYYTEAGN
ncbi:unnamed protein product [Clonostachys rosea f. rosea IK726]|uniref:Uncharacterized protein n=1 Tax=Clonostachys rosea f. rosea IK726 TaxID=1349383 RepID=A0ACA9U7E7_BIOOC|nr:unnamed protein product [Clonostachys rosea f. rosea IK726]